MCCNFFFKKSVYFLSRFFWWEKVKRLSRNHTLSKSAFTSVSLEHPCVIPKDRTPVFPPSRRVGWAAQALQLQEGHIHTQLRHRRQSHSGTVPNHIAELRRWRWGESAGKYQPKQSHSKFQVGHFRWSRWLSSSLDSTTSWTSSTRSRTCNPECTCCTPSEFRRAKP